VEEKRKVKVNTAWWW